MTEATENGVIDTPVERTNENGSVPKSKAVSDEPLPDTIEETRAKLNQMKRLPKPDPKDREVEFAAVQAKIDKLRHEKQKVEQEITAIRDQGSGAREERAAARANLDRIREEQNRVKKEKDDLLRKEQASREALNAMKAQERKMRDQIKFKSPEEVHREIERLEQRQSTESLSLKEEKEILMRIKELKGSLKLVDELSAQKSNLDKANEKKNEFAVLLKQKNDELRAISRKFDEALAELKAVDSKMNSQGSNYPELVARSKQITKEINDLYKKKKEVYAAFQAKADEFYQQGRLRKRLTDHIRKLEDEEIRKEEEERRKVREEEEMSRKPWTEEIDMCDHLISYLKKLIGEDKAPGSESTSTQPRTNLTSKRVAIPEGMKPLKKSYEDDDEDDIYSKMESKKKNKKKGKKKRGTQGSMTFSMDMLQYFDRLSLVPPATMEAVPASIQELEKKRAYFDTLPRDAKPQGAQTSSSVTTSLTFGEASDESSRNGSTKAKNGKSKQKSSAMPSVDNVDSFPSLPGQRSPKFKPSVAHDGPSALDLVKANGTNSSVNTEDIEESQANQDEVEGDM